MRLLWDPLPAGDHRVSALLAARDAFLSSCKGWASIGEAAS